MPLSARTVHDRTIMMANQVEEMQVKDIYAAPFFSLALDESTDFITHPNECSLNTADLSYIPGVSVRDFEAEVADLKASDMWVNKFKSLNEDLERIARQKAELASKHMWTEMKNLQPEDQLIIKTWNALPVTYHTLQRVSIAVLTMFGSTYACEQSFSDLKNIKSNLRSRLTDESLNACMKLNLTKYQPDYKAISKSMQHQKSH
ncbi:hypothetical protein FQN60_005327 [Etheostoma spectabile]|uniref:HAT C-terminal dimerisation domain-containing protein n=1 Tax=Etheostoma spectabile TaxID=54343 RepID=A0A5J5CCD9_9PERO|nr:hypothetical protein FQN60_005327 [Etheostoma spectabile]